MPELLQQAIHIQQLLHMLARDLECLFNRVEVEHQLHLTILLLTDVDCRQEVTFSLSQILERYGKLQLKISS